MVSICPTDAAQKAGRPSLTPELLAASGARYSRNNEGLDAILSKIDPNNLDKAVDGIFKMVDYGHQSIADMAPVSMFIDGISMWLAYLVWTQVPTAGGQESSTRYLRLDESALIPAAELGIPVQLARPWDRLMRLSIDAYQEALELWEEVGEAQPELTRIPASLLGDPSDKAQKQVARMQRNYAFDRARYFLPVALRTNMMLVMSARAWTQLCQWLLSHPLLEARRLGEAILPELELTAPRLLRHATSKPSFEQGLKAEFEDCVHDAGGGDTDRAFLEVFPPANQNPDEISKALAHHDNRYAYSMNALRRIGVRFGWDAVAFAEIRDLNRHRTGSKYCPQVPRGVYDALDEWPVGKEGDRKALQSLSQVLHETLIDSRKLLSQSVPEHVYWGTLGHTFPFEHTTTSDKFIYEAELRTGTGAHYRYAKHLRDALALWYVRYPGTRGLVLEGSAEPE